MEEFFLASNGSEIEASESVTIEDRSSTDENNKTVYHKIYSMISKESVLALKTIGCLVMILLTPYRICLAESIQM